MIASFFRRVVFQLKQTWIFFQLEFMHVFNQFLNSEQGNNSLMTGLMDYKDTSFVEKKLKLSKEHAHKNHFAGTNVLYGLEQERFWRSSQCQTIVQKL